MGLSDGIGRAGAAGRAVRQGLGNDRFINNEIGGKRSLFIQTIFPGLQLQFRPHVAENVAK